MKRRKMIVAIVAAVTVLAAGSTAFAGAIRHRSPSLSLSASAYTGGAILARGEYHTNDCGPPIGHTVTLYEGSQSLGSVITVKGGHYRLVTGPQTAGSHSVFGNVPGFSGGKYGHPVVCSDATSGTVNVVIPAH